MTHEAASALLEKALPLIARRSAWTKCAYARDRHGHHVRFDSGRAVRFCAGGALLRALIECGACSPSAAELQLASSLLGEALCNGLSEPDSVELVATLQRKRRAGSSGGPAAEQHWQLIVEINDLPTTRHRQVVAAFEAAIREARATRR